MVWETEWIFREILCRVLNSNLLDVRHFDNNPKLNSICPYGTLVDTSLKCANKNANNLIKDVLSDDSEQNILRKKKKL